MTTTTKQPLLTLEDLAERWGVSEDTIRDHVRHDQLPYVAIGGGKKRPIMRFRLAAVEAWEASRERVARGEEPAPPPPAVLAGVWDGKSRLGSGKGRPKGAK